MRYYKKIILLLVLFCLIAPAGLALADPPLDPTYGAGVVRDKAGLPQKVANVDNLPDLIGVVIGVALSGLGVVFFLIIFYAGFRWMTARGKSEVIDASKETLEQAVIGLVLVIAAYAIANFVFTAIATGKINP
ncbi:MAG: hypothetical protein Q7S66_04275 [bacterium]|nr:hypothetical protein [bacterium]